MPGAINTPRLRPVAIRAGAISFAVATLLLGPAVARAQLTGAIEGAVTDPAGGAVNAAEMRVVEVNTNAERRLATDARGRYRAAQLVPGQYRLHVRAPGFEPAETDVLELTAGVTVQADIELKVGSMRQSLEVTAETSKVDSEAVDWGSAIDTRQLESLPLKGRDIFDLAAQQPGVAVPATATQASDVGLGLKVIINGNRPSENAFRLDGIYINDATGSAPSSAAGNLLGIDTLAELRIIASPFSAEYGRTDGGVITAVSKSGANDFHGAAWEYLRNSAMNAKNFFDPPGKIPELRLNQFGGLLSGPVVKNKLFFLADFEGIRSATDQTQILSVPDAQARQGLLPVKGVLTPVKVSPAILPYLALYPLPNGPDLGNGTGEYIGSQPGTLGENYVVGKVDYVPSDRWRFGTRYTFDTSNTTSLDGYQFWTFDNQSHYNLVQTTAQFVQSPQLVHDFRAAFSQIFNGATSSVPGSSSDISFVPGSEMGAIQVVGLTDFGSTPARTAPRHFNDVNAQASYSAEKIAGRHSISFGASYDRILLGENADLDRNGYYQFSSLQSFLAAQPNKLGIMAVTSDTLRHWSYNEFAAFVQDSWRISRRLSVSVGLRYETATTPQERDHKTAALPDPLTDTQVLLGGPIWLNPSKLNFAPRASIAWSPLRNGRTVVRAGAGIFNDLLGTRELTTSGVLMPPFYEHYNISKPLFPGALEAVSSSSNPTFSANFVSYNASQPYSAQYQLAVQHDLGRKTLLEASYAGARGIHLVGDMNNINTTVPEYLPDGTIYFPATNPPINPAFGNLEPHLTAFDSYYNSLLTSLRTQPLKGLYIQGKFVWSHSIDNDSVTIHDDSYNYERVPTVFDLAANRGSSDFDSRLNFFANFIWRLPGVRSRAANAVLGGWELDGIAQVQSGNPFNPTVGFDDAHLLGSGDQGQRSNFVSGVPVITGNPSQYFNPLAFSLPPSGYLGNLGRNVFTGPGLQMYTLALERDFLKVEKRALRLRVEGFNVANHPNFQIPSGLGLFDSTGARLGTAGRITATTTSSRQLQLAARYTF